MARTDETVRGAVAFSTFFGGLVPLALRSRHQAREQAWAMALEHASHVRRRAGIDFTLDGEPVQADQPFVLVYNQTSFVEDLANIDVLARLRIDRAVFAAEYRWIPFFASAAPRWGVVLLRRGHRTEVERVLGKLVAALRAGERVSMAPEGRLSSDGKVGHFKRGAFLVAIRAGVPVIPMATRGGRDILTPGTLRIRPGLLRYRIGSPLSTQGLAEADAPVLAERARCVVASLHESLRA